VSTFRAFGIPLTTIGRPIDPRVPTNRAILILVASSFAFGSIAWGALGAPWSDALLRGLSLGGAVFFGWALARETDPDRAFSAFFAAVGAGAGTILLGNPHFLLVLWLLLSLRFVNRSTGVAPGVLDWGALYGLKLWLGFAAHWTIPLLTFPTLFFAGLNRLPRPLRVILPLVIPGAAVGYGIHHAWSFAPPLWGSVEVFVLAGVATGVIPVVASYRAVRSVGDRTGDPLVPHRVQWMLGWAAAAAITLTLSGTASLADIAPLWAALAGTTLGWVVDVTLRRRRAD